METAKFYKVSYEQFEGAMLDDFDLTKEQVKEIYDNFAREIGREGSSEG